MKRFQAKVEQLDSMLDWIRSQSRKWDKKIELACEEVIVNIIRHGYRERQGEIEIGVTETKERLVIEIRDTAPPFNPLHIKAPKIDSSLDKREVGGLGIFFVRQCVDEMHYRHEGTTNILTLVRNY